jgi:hypothetical protein
MPVMAIVEARSPIQYAKLSGGAQHISRRTEEAYVAGIRRYIFFHHKRHPAQMGAPEVTKFLTSLAVDGHVAASTQNQVLSGHLFLYRMCWRSTSHGSTASCARSAPSGCRSSSRATRYAPCSSGSTA